MDGGQQKGSLCIISAELWFISNKKSVLSLKFSLIEFCAGLLPDSPDLPTEPVCECLLEHLFDVLDVPLLYSEHLATLKYIKLLDLLDVPLLYSEHITTLKYIKLLDVLDVPLLYSELPHYPEIY